MFLNETPTLGTLRYSYAPIGNEVMQVEVLKSRELKKGGKIELFGGES